MSALHKVNNKVTAQTEKAKATQKKNNAGGYTFVVSEKDRFRRFLTLGTDKGTYYVTESKLTEQNVKFVKRYIAANGVDAVNEIVEVSDQGLAPKNTYAIFALAMVFAGDDPKAKVAARRALPKVCRTGTHLFEFASFIRNNSSWSSSQVKALRGWYEGKTTDQLAYQTVKYRSRHDFTHKDLFCLGHPAGIDPVLGNFIMGKEFDVDAAPEIVQAFEALKVAKNEKQVLALLDRFPSATWEMIPTEFHKSAKVWRKLFENGMPQTALIRNTTRMARLGLFDDMVFAGEYAKALMDQKNIEKGRVHPINYLNASVVFSEGQYDRSYGYSYYCGRKKDWKTNSKVSAALDRGYELAFKNIEPANKRTMLALDVSGSMTSACAGLDLNCAQVTGAMANMISKTEPYSLVMGFATQFRDLNISESDSLPTVMRKIRGHTFGRTDCAAPMVYAKKKGIEVDTFIVLTDNETYAGSVHPFQALKNYRKETGIDAKLVVVAAAGTKFTIADPSDPGMLDISGVDSSGPRVIADFSAGRI